MKNHGTLRAGLTAWMMALLTAVGLQACGGGGGGGGDTSTSANGTDTQTLTSGIRIAAVAGEYVSAQKLTVPYPASGKSFVTLDDTSTVLNVSYTLSDAGVVLSVGLIRDVKEGSSLEYITLKYCEDASCSKVRAVRRVPVSIEGSRGLSVLYGRTNSVFAAAGGAGTEVLWPISVPAQPGTLTLKIMSLKDGLPPPWLQAELVGTTAIRLRPSGVGMPIGRFGADIWLSYDRGAGFAPLSFRQGMNIELDSAGCWPSSVFDGSLISVDAQTREEPVDRYTINCFGAPEGAWTAKLDNGLYRVNEKPAGEANQLVLTMNSAALLGISTGTRIDTQVTLSSPGLPDRSFSFGVRVNLPEVTQVTPARVRAGAAATVELGGSSLGVGANGVIFVGEKAALSVVYGTAGTLIVQLPALASGSYPVCARNELKLPRPCAMLTVDP